MSQKQAFYSTLLNQVEAITEGEPDWVANMANVSALLFHSLEQVNWVGFYRRQREQLVLGPFQGQVACIRIPLGNGVCGVAAEKNEVQRIADVHQFEGHIACDAASNSEIVLPIVHKGNVVAVLDIDSPEFNRFDEADEQGLTAIQSYLNSIAGE
ncbi:GAF domain-containing protein [Paraferrimonas haliotis]|uniref:GAF domain-containing protein n=1 Tax=Paraferrimonas haliotis TaxID=2013866 RepID=UPI000BA8E3DE|nr:GAF domain-containing protein [Paraferrimonas haliotis]